MNETGKFIGAFAGTFTLVVILAMLAARNHTVLMAFSFIIPVVFFIYPRALCTSAVYKMEMDGNETKLGKLLCYVPFYNTYYSRKLQYMSAPVVGGLMIFVVLEIFLVTPIARFAFNSGDSGLLINMVVSWVNILCITILWAVEAYINVTLSRHVGYNNIVLCIVAPPIASFFLAGKIRVFFNKYKNELRGTFKGGK